MVSPWLCGVSFPPFLLSLHSPKSSLNCLLQTNSDLGEEQEKRKILVNSDVGQEQEKRRVLLILTWAKGKKKEVSFILTWAKSEKKGRVLLDNHCIGASSPLY